MPGRLFRAVSILIIFVAVPSTLFAAGESWPDPFRGRCADLKMRPLNHEIQSPIGGGSQQTCDYRDVIVAASHHSYMYMYISLFLWMASVGKASASIHLLTRAYVKLGEFQTGELAGPSVSPARCRAPPCRPCGLPVRVNRRKRSDEQSVWHPHDFTSLELFLFHPLLPDHPS